MNAQSKDKSVRICGYVVEQAAAEMLPELEGSEFFWEGRLPSGAYICRKVVVETAEQVVSAVKNFSAIGVEPNAVLSSPESALMDALLEPGVPETNLWFAVDEPAVIIEALTHPIDVLEEWTAFCDRGEALPQVLLEGEGAALSRPYAEAFEKWINRLPEPERLESTPDAGQLETLMRDSIDPVWNELVGKFLGESLQERAMQYVDMLQDSDGWTRAIGAEGLGRLGSPFASPRILDNLVQALTDDEGEVREAALRALGLMDEAGVTAAVLDALVERLADKNAGVRQAASEALGKLNATAATDAVLFALEQRSADSDTSVSEAAVRAVEVLRSSQQAELDKEPIPSGRATKVQRLERDFADRFRDALSATKEWIELLRGTPQDFAADMGFASTQKRVKPVEVFTADGTVSGELTREDEGRQLVLRLFGEKERLAGKTVDLVLFRADGTLLMAPITCTLEPSRSGQGVVGFAQRAIEAVEGEPAKYDLSVRDSEEE